MPQNKEKILKIKKKLRNWDKVVYKLLTKLSRHAILLCYDKKLQRQPHRNEAH